VSIMRGGRIGRRLVLAGLAVLAAACASPPPEPVDAVAGQWLGRFSLVLTEPGVERQQEKAQGRFELRAHGERRALEVFSPFGQTLAQLEDRPGRARLTTSDGAVLESDTAENLLERALGWRLPIGELPAWLGARGTDPQAPGSDWRVRVTRRFDDGRPRILEADWPATPRVGTRELRVRIVVDGP